MKLRVLVLTRQLTGFTGSELVAWEVAEWFANRGDDVVVATRQFGGSIASLERRFEVTTDLGELKLDRFDLVWSQHQMILLVPYGIERCVLSLRMPLVAAVTLSPFQVAEHLDGIIVRAMRAHPWANSEETAIYASAISRRLLPLRAFHVFHNAAPGGFWEQSPPRGERLERILVVSNHIPRQLRGAIELVRAAGIEVTVVGVEDDALRVDRELVAKANAVVTIGKTVIYALAVGRPVFVYDHFGGDGWLTQQNMAENLKYNFSGRPQGRSLRADALAEELMSGFEGARAALPGLLAGVPHLVLDDHLNHLRRAATRDHPRLRAVLTGVAFMSRAFRAHLETVRRLTSAVP